MSGRGGEAIGSGTSITAWGIPRSKCGQFHVVPRSCAVRQLLRKSRTPMGGPVMTDASTGSPEVHGYHAHVYYDQDTLPAAVKLRETLGANFPVKVGRLSDEPIG